ncbi:hypothetical protein BsWGS_14005 [Bradybaena similaris]
MSKGTSIKDALKQFEDETGQKAKDAKIVKLIAKLPFIDKMDATLSQLESCEHLSLGTNKIEKIANLNGLRNLKVLALSRNALKTLQGVEVLGDTLQELWVSYNMIDKFKGITGMKKLKVLYMAHNRVSEMAEVGKLSTIASLEDLLLVGNPIEEAKSEEGVWFPSVKKQLKQLKKLDGTVLAGDED